MEEGTGRPEEHGAQSVFRKIKPNIAALAFGGLRKRIVMKIWS